MTEVEPYVAHERDSAEQRWGDIVSWRTLLSADRTPTEGLTVGTAELAAGAPTEGACHRHLPAEVYYILEGEGRVHIDGTDHPVVQGSAVFVPGNAWHYVTNTGPQTLRLLYVFAVDGFDEVVYEFETGEEPGREPSG